MSRSSSSILSIFRGTTQRFLLPKIYGYHLSSVSEQSIGLPDLDGKAIHRPPEPLPDECCGRGCAECVWTTYWDNLKAYESAKAALEGKERPLDPFEELERRLISPEKKNTDKDDVS